MRKLFLIMMLILAVGLAQAARPLDTDDTGTVEKGKSETELSFDYCRYRTEGNCQSPTLSIKHGLTERLDLGLGFAHSTDKDADGNTVGWGMSPLEIGFKMALLKENKILPGISFSAGYEAGQTGYGLNMIFSRFYRNLGLHFNLGYNSPGEAIVKGTIVTSFAMEYTFMEKYRVCGELNSEILDNRSEVLENSGLVGGSIDLGFVVWDMGLRIYDKRGPQSSITTGFTLGF